MSERPLLPARIAACLLGLDGVLTRISELHAEAWKQTFDDFLHSRAAAGPVQARPFDLVADYARYVDGKPRADGVRSFLAARGVELPEGSPDDPPAAETVHRLGARKNQVVLALMAQRGVSAYPGSARFVAVARAAGLARAVVTSSENAQAVLKAAGLEDAFDARVDGAIANELGLAGEPAPDVYLEAARRLGVQPVRAAVFEDALAGVAAGRAGDFGLVVGVDRSGHGPELRAGGADVVVGDLAELIGAP